MRKKPTNTTIKLTVMASEPLARLAEQRLHHEGIRCMVRTLGAGPGGWGTAANLPYGLYVKEADEMRARQVLELSPMEIVERETEDDAAISSRSSLPLLLGAALALIVIALVMGNLLG